MTGTIFSRIVLPHIRPPSLVGIVHSLAMVALATVTLAFIISLTELRHISIGYVIPVLISAVRWGVVESLVAALAAIGAAAFFFYAPIYDFRVFDPLQIVDLVLFVFVAVVTGHLAARLRAEVERANQREAEIGALYAFSRRLATANTASDIYDAIQHHIVSLVGRKAVLFEANAPHAEPAERFARGEVPACVQAAVAAAEQKGGGSRRILRDESGNTWLVRPLSEKSPDFGIIAIDLGHHAHLMQAEMHQKIETAIADAAATLERLGVEAAIAEARTRKDTERLRDALLGSVSHELRTPLASILGATTALARSPQVGADSRLSGLANVAREEAERLNDEIQNLLDATRINSGLRPKFEWSELSDIVNAALDSRRLRLAQHVLDLRLSPDLPLLYVDSALLQQALGQILDNAAKYSAPASTIRIEAGRVRTRAVLTVTDQGAGFSLQEKQHAGQRFFRGGRHASSTPGVGLGLWIARAFVAANAGTLDVASRGEGQGAAVSIALPVPRERDEPPDSDHA